MNLKQKIINLRKDGKTYNEIKKILSCSKGTISFHLNPKVREKQRIRQWRGRSTFVRELKMLHGGKCAICGYSKSWNALQFHHTDPAIKKFAVSNSGFKTEVRAEEAKKCVLLCANCHIEVHAGISDLPDEHPS